MTAKRDRLRRSDIDMSKFYPDETVKSIRTHEVETYRRYLRRCYDPTHPDYPLYGGANPPATFCAKWRNSVFYFLEDMGKQPPHHVLARIRDDRPYSKKNCEWRRKDWTRVAAAKKLAAGTAQPLVARPATTRPPNPVTPPSKPYSALPPMLATPTPPTSTTSVSRRGARGPTLAESNPVTAEEIAAELRTPKDPQP
jgi:hypothetical protein